MLKTLAVANYRSVLDLVVPLERLNVVTGANGSGKSNLYRALRLLAETAREGPAGILAREGGLRSTYWAGPEQLSRGMRKREVAVQGGPRKGPVRLKLGFAGEDFGYAISFGLPPPSSQTAFSLDPEIKRECIWAGPSYRSAAALLDRENAVVKVRRERDWEIVVDRADPFDSMLRQVADPVATPEAFRMRESIRGWRFYDHFRTDAQAPARLSHLGTRTPVLHHDGSDLAAAIQTIREIPASRPAAAARASHRRCIRPLAGLGGDARGEARGGARIRSALPLHPTREGAGRDADRRAGEPRRARLALARCLTRGEP